MKANRDAMSAGSSHLHYCPTDGREERCTVYTLTEISDIIVKYGLPQEWNAAGALGPERYVEVQIWDDGPIQELPDRFDLI